MDFQYRLETSLDFDAAVEAVQAITAGKGFRVLHVHDVQKTLAEKGFSIEPLKIIEICNAKHANRALGADITVSLFMPCKINVYRQGGKTVINGLRPSVMAAFFPAGGLEDLAAEVDSVVRAIIDEAAGLTQ